MTFLLRLLLQKPIPFFFFFAPSKCFEISWTGSDFCMTLLSSQFTVKTCSSNPRVSDYTPQTPFPQDVSLPDFVFFSSLSPVCGYTPQDLLIISFYPFL